jgi:hypothetical protein
MMVEGTHRPPPIRQAVTHDQQYFEAMLAEAKRSRLLLERIEAALSAKDAEVEVKP